MNGHPEIHPSQIVPEVTQAITSARTSVRATMRAGEALEELNDSRFGTAVKYYLLLKQKVLDQRVRLARVGFGSEEDFNQLARYIHVDDPDNVARHHPLYSFHMLDDLPNYKRMILIDDSILFYSIPIEHNGRRYFCTNTDDDPLFVSDYRSHFQSLWAKNARFGF